MSQSIRLSGPIQSSFKVNFFSINPPLEESLGAEHSPRCNHLFSFIRGRQGRWGRLLELWNDHKAACCLSDPPNISFISPARCQRCWMDIIHEHLWHAGYSSLAGMTKPCPPFGWQIHSVLTTIRNRTNLLRGVIFRLSEIAPLDKSGFFWFLSINVATPNGQMLDFMVLEWWKSCALLWLRNSFHSQNN